MDSKRREVMFTLNTCGWKSIVINCNADLHKSYNNLLIIKNNTKESIPVDQIKILIIESEQVNITSALMSFLIENNIRIIFCDKRHNPSFETVSYAYKNR